MDAGLAAVRMSLADSPGGGGSLARRSEAPVTDAVIGPSVCDHRVIDEPSILSDLKARLAALHDRGAGEEEVPGGNATGDQLDAMRESMEILSDPEMAARVRAGRLAVAGAEVVSFEQLGGPSPTPDRWRVVLTAPVARELALMDQLSGAAVREMLVALAGSPAEHGRALGMGLVGVWSARTASHRILYAIAPSQRLVTVLTVDAH